MHDFMVGLWALRWLIAFAVIVVAGMCWAVVACASTVSPTDDDDPSWDDDDPYPARRTLHVVRDLPKQ